MIRRIALGTTVAVLLSGCAGTSTAPTAEPEGPLPPNNAQQLAAIFDPYLSFFDLKLTRGALIDRSQNRYERSDTGTHLALYAEPTGSVSAKKFLEHFTPLSRVLVPMVFERWPGLETFDICQEPHPAVDGRDQPPPVTQIEVSREQADAIDWATVDLEGLVAAAVNDPPGARIVFSRVIRRMPEVRAAYEAATGEPLSR